MADDVPADNASYQREGVDLPPAVVVSFVTAPPVAVEINWDLLTWDDLVNLQSLADKEDMTQRQQMDAMADLLGKVTGKDIHTLPYRVGVALLDELRKLASGQAEKNAG